MRHIQNNYQYMTHVVEAGIKDFKLSNLHLSKDAFAKPMNSNSMLNGTSQTQNLLPKKPEPILGNVYGSLKRASNSSEIFIYEYFEGSTNKIKHPLKFSALLEMFEY